MQAYPLYPRRQHEILDGFWDFCWLGDQADLDALDPKKLAFNQVTGVPGVFDTSLDNFGRRGVVVYRRRIYFPVPAGTPLRLKLGGLGLFGRIWWNGRHLADYELPYTALDYDFVADGSDHQELVIAVDNRFDAARSPLFSPNFDFYAYGGIYRSVELQQLPVTRIERAQVITLDPVAGLVRVRLRLGGELPPELKFTLAFDRETPREYSAPVKQDGIELEMKVPQPRVWSPADPQLHLLTVTTPTDQVIERFGLRTIATRGQEILLNGQPLRLKGVCRHESHPEFGPVQSPHLLSDDLRLIKDLGANFIRGVHYAQDQAFLDLCDQAGVLVWQESLGWGNTEAQFRDPRFLDLQQRETRAMVESGANHPSVIIWAFINEGASQVEAARHVYSTLAQTIRTADPSRLVSYASCRHEHKSLHEYQTLDQCFEFADLISVNLYPGWWGANDWSLTIGEWIEPRLEAAVECFNQPPYRDKPLLVTEIGVCALYGCHDRALAQWSEEFQADYFRRAVTGMLVNERFAGFSLWQMFDTRSYVNAGPDVRGKPRGFNCAGLLDEYRRPKLAYDAVREVLRKR